MCYTNIIFMTFHTFYGIITLIFPFHILKEFQIIWLMKIFTNLYLGRTVQCNNNIHIL